MKSNHFALLGTATVMLFLFLATTNCKKDTDYPLPGDPGVIDSLLAASLYDTACKYFYLGLAALPHLQQPTPIPNPTNLGASTTEESGNYICNMQTVQWSPEYDELYLLDPRNEIIYPASLLDANSVPGGAYTPITNVARGPATISVSLLTQPGVKPYITVENPSLSTIRDATNTLLHGVAPGSTPAFINFDIQKVRAEEEVALSIQANFSGWGAKVSASYGFESQEQKSRFLVRFYQKYYTIDMDFPQTPCAFFDADELPDLATFHSVSPVYVSSVTYGRMVYFMVESSASYEAMEAALSASFNSFVAGGGIDISYQHRQLLEQSHTSALVVGGNADGAVQLVNGVQGLLNFLTAEGDFSVTSPGAPIAYTMRYLNDNSVARIVLSSEYTIRNCEIKGEEYTFTPNNNAGEGYYYCAQNTVGDGEFDGNGPLVTGTVTLVVENGNELYAKVDFVWLETNQDTRGEVHEKFHLHTLPIDKQFVGFTTDANAYVEYTDTDHGVDTPPVTGGDFVEKVMVVGDTGGNDLGCDGDADANVRIWLKPIKIMVRPL